MFKQLITFAETIVSRNVFAITKQVKKPLSKSQKTFDQLIKKIERLQNEIKTENNILDDKLRFYNEHIHPLEKQQIVVLKDVVKLLYQVFREPKMLSSKERNVLSDIMRDFVDYIYAHDSEELTDELNDFFKRVEDLTRGEAHEQRNGVNNSKHSAMFGRNDLNKGFDQLNINISQGEFAQRPGDMVQYLNMQKEGKSRQKKYQGKNQKQLEEEEMERQLAELKSNSASNIYNYLTNIMHLELEQEVGEKIRKEALMNDLTNAYRNNDLYTLLKLEFEWIQAEGVNIEQLPESKIGIYNKALKEHVAALDEEFSMVSHHPRFMPIRHFAMFPQMLKNVNLGIEMESMIKELDSLKRTLNRLQGKEALEEVKALIEDYE